MQPTFVRTVRARTEMDADKRPLQPGRCPTSGSRKEHGQSLVELAVVVPLLFVFLFGIFEFSNILRTQIQIQNAVREGARFATLSGCPTDSAIQTKVQAVAAGLPITTSSTYTPSPCSACLGVQVPTVKISGTYTYTAITPVGVFLGLFGGTFGNSIALSSQSTLNNEC